MEMTNNQNEQLDQNGKLELHVGFPQPRARFFMPSKIFRCFSPSKRLDSLELPSVKLI